MTREEAIRQLDGADIAVLNRNFFKFNQAIIMAISALRQRDQSPDSRKMMQRDPMTNAERIRAMSDEELAKLLLDGCRGSKCDDQPQNEWGSVNCFQCRLDWLQQPAEEDTHETD